MFLLTAPGSSFAVKHIARFGAGLTLLLAFYLQRVYKAHASPVYVLTNVRWIKVDGGKATSVLFENVRKKFWRGARGEG